MKKLLYALPLFFCAASFGQVKISDFPTFSGNPSGAWVPVVIAGANRKVDAFYFSIGKVDSAKYRIDSMATAALLALKVGSAKYATDSTATVSAIAAKVKYTDTAAMLSTYARTIAVPTNNNQLTNGAAFITASGITGKVNYSDTASMLVPYVLKTKHTADSSTLRGLINGNTSSITTNTANIASNTTAIAGKQTNQKIVSVLDYGAVPDGTTNSSTAFTNAFAAGGVVYIPRGAYVVMNVAIPSNTTIYGDSAILKNTGSSNTSIFTSTNATGWIIRGLQFVGTNTTSASTTDSTVITNNNQNGLTITGFADQSRLYNCSFTGFYGYGIKWTNTNVPLSPHTGIAISGGCNFLKNYTGLYIGNYCEYSLIDGDYFDQNTFGVTNLGAGNKYISSSFSNGYYGMQVLPATTDGKGSITYNTFSGCGQVLYYGNVIGPETIQGNFFGTGSITFAGGLGVSVSSNTFQLNGGSLNITSLYGSSFTNNITYTPQPTVNWTSGYAFAMGNKDKNDADWFIVPTNSIALTKYLNAVNNGSYSSIQATNNTQLVFFTGGNKALTLWSDESACFQSGGTHTNPGSAQVAINSTSRGFLPPRMTAAQFNGIGLTAGLIGFATDADRMLLHRNSVYDTMTTMTDIRAANSTTATLTNKTITAPIIYATYVAKSTSYTLTVGDEVVEVTASGQTMTLPTAVGNAGKSYTIKLTSASSTCTVNTTSSQTIDGSTTFSLSAQYKYIRVISNGANWLNIGSN